MFKLFFSVSKFLIKSEHMERIFGLFQRSETSRGTQGAGLGLAIVREIAERHRGRVWVASGLHRGTTFYISLARDMVSNPLFDAKRT